MIRVLILLAILCTLLPAFSQELSFDETVAYINEKIGATYTIPLKNGGYQEVTHTLTIDKFCRSTLESYTTESNGYFWNKKYQFNLNELTEINDWVEINLREPNDKKVVSLTETTKTGGYHDMRSYINIECKEEDVARLIKAFTHLQGLCKKDPFDN